VFPNQTALIKTKFGKHETIYNFMMLKHYNEEEIKTMAKSPEEAEKGSENNKNTSTQKTTGSEDP
jgi:hypothetical protein